MGTGCLPEQTTIILYGRSLLLDSLEQTLRQDGRFPILRLLDTHTPPQLTDVPVGVLIYDHIQADLTAVYQLLTNYPGWQLIGLTASAGELLVIHSEKYNGRSLADVIDIIQRKKRRNK